MALERPGRRLRRWLRGLGRGRASPPSPRPGPPRAHGLGEPCTARLADETVEGVAEGLDADGALRLRLADGAIRRITAGDVFFEERLSMLLAIEQGNTNTLFAVHDGDELDRPVARGHRSRRAPPTNTPSGCRQLLAMAGPEA